MGSLLCRPQPPQTTLDGGLTMRVSGITENCSQNAGGIHSLDAAGRDGMATAIQKQMTNVQNQMRGIAANEELSREEKESAKKELQRHLQDLNDQLARKKAELHKDGGEKAAVYPPKSAVGAGDEAVDILFEEEFLQGVLNTDSSIKQVGAARIAMMKMRARAKTLETEIQLDNARGVSTAKKEELLSSLKSRLQDISAKLSNHAREPDSPGREIALGGSSKGGGNKAEKARDQVIIQIETRIPLRFRKVWDYGKGRVVNIKL